MRIALFSDIHANLPALQACLKSIDAQDVDAIYCLGDLVGYNVWPNEVVNEIRKRGIPTIAGNYDEGIGLMSDECGCAYKTDPEKDMGKISISYTNNLIKPKERNYLRTLPSHLRVEFKLNNEQMNLLLVHGSPRKINEYLFEDREDHRVLPSQVAEGQSYRHAINIGSVGKPKDADPRGCYVILTINSESNKLDRNAIDVEFVRFEYDVEKAAKAIEDSPLPNEFAEMLRRGF
jgi:predicted phosphodiesterase